MRNVSICSSGITGDSVTHPEQFGPTTVEGPNVHTSKPPPMLLPALEAGEGGVSGLERAKTSGSEGLNRSTSLQSDGEAGAVSAETFTWTVTVRWLPALQIEGADAVVGVPEQASPRT